MITSLGFQNAVLRVLPDNLFRRCFEVNGFNAAGNTYVEVQTGAGDSVWFAVPLASLVEGDQVVWQGDSLMRGFTSETLGKTFPEIHFVSAVQVRK